MKSHGSWSTTLGEVEVEVSAYSGNARPVTIATEEYSLSLTPDEVRVLVEMLDKASAFLEEDTDGTLSP